MRPDVGVLVKEEFLQDTGYQEILWIIYRLFIRDYLLKMRLC